jgi:hypothetical protein
VTDKDVQMLSNLTGLADLNLWGCRNLTSEVLQTVSSLTALTTLMLSLPAGCAEDAAYAKAVCALTTLTALRFHAERYKDGQLAEAGAWKLDLSRLTTLNLWCCYNMTAEGLRAVSGLTTLTTLNLGGCNVTDEGLQTLSTLAALFTLELYCCPNLTAAAKQALRTAIPNLTIEG